MTLFGRTGTNLLPMFARGAKGIEELQQEARRLGLTMSAEDAKAAEDFTDALDKLWKVVKMGVYVPNDLYGYDLVLGWINEMVDQEACETASSST